MFRTIRNIILLLVLCLIATGMPLYADTVDISFPTLGHASINLQLTGELTQVNSHQWKISTTLSVDGKSKAIRLDSTNPLSVELFSGDKLIHTVDLKDGLLTTLQTDIANSQPLHFEITLDQRELNVPDGLYRILLRANTLDLQDPVEPYESSLEFKTEGSYRPSLGAVNRRETALTLYFPNANNSYLVPITRIIPYTIRPLRSTLDQLEMGPSPELGLSPGSPVPEQSRISLNKKVAGVYLPQDIGKYEINATDAAMALGSFVNSLTSIPDVNSVQFYFNNRIVETGFHGTAMDRPHYPQRGPLIYGITYTDTDRMLLLPINYLEDNPSIDELFNAMKYSGNENLYDSINQPPIPESVNLLDHQLSEGILTLNFDQSLLKAFEGDQDRQAAMFEAILYSFGSLDSVDSLVIQTAGQEVTNFADLSLTYPLKLSPYINPEE